MFTRIIYNYLSFLLLPESAAEISSTILLCSHLGTDQATCWVCHPGTFLRITRESQPQPVRNQSETSALVHTEASPALLTSPSCFHWAWQPLFWVHKAQTPPFHKGRRICRLTKLKVRLHSWQDDDADNGDKMMSHVVPSQLMHNWDAALIKYYSSSLSSPVISILNLALAFLRIILFLSLKGLQVSLLIQLCLCHTTLLTE